MTETPQAMAERIREQRAMTPLERARLAKRRADIARHTRDCRDPNVRARYARSHQT